MRWDEEECKRRSNSLPLIDLGIRCTLSQLIETGVMHADPHGGNLLRLDATGELAYLDFGLVSEVPAEVRDGLVAAVTLLVFSRDYEGVASLFGDLQLVPRDVLENEYQFRGLVQSLKEAADSALVFPEDECEEICEGETEAEGAAAAREEHRPGRALRPAPRRAPRARAQIPVRFASVLPEQRQGARDAGGHGAERGPELQHPPRRVPVRGEAPPVQPDGVQGAAKGAAAARVRQEVARLPRVQPHAAQARRRGRRRAHGRLAAEDRGADAPDEAGVEPRARGGVLGALLRDGVRPQGAAVVCGITPTIMLYKAVVTFLSGGLQKEPID